ncbi:MAG: ABC transporter permease [Leptolyngbyaceae bacterium]|nr:ABC transporter permease [Leptolyngbyaceae bacterium]
MFRFIKHRASTFRIPAWPTIFSIGLFGFMYVPILVLAVYSFNESRYGATWTGFSLRWYAQLLGDQRLLLALRSSLLIAVGAVGIAAVLGTLMAVGLSRYRFPGKNVYQGVAYLPLIVPDITIAVSTLIFLATLAIPLSIWTTVAAHVVFCLAYIAIVVSTRLADLNPQLEEAALDLGATPRQAFVKVLLPELAPAILSGCLLAFVLSLDDLLISSFTFGGGASPLPIEIFSRIRIGVKPDINALSVVLITESGAIAVAAEYLRYRTVKR